MSKSVKIREYITRPDNLEFALDLSFHLDEIKKHIHQQFWELFNHKMSVLLSASKYSAWTYQSHPAKKYRTIWGKSYITPVNVKPKTLESAFGQGARGEGFRLFLGVVCHSPPNDIATSEIKDLIAILIENDITLDEKQTGWVKWGYSPYTVYSAEFIRNMHEDPKAQVEEIANHYFEIFEKIKPLLEEYNKGI